MLSEYPGIIFFNKTGDPQKLTPSFVMYLPHICENNCDESYVGFFHGTFSDFCCCHQVAHDDDDLDQTAGQSKKTGRRKPAYLGGLVLEPKRGWCCLSLRF